MTTQCHSVYFFMQLIITCIIIISLFIYFRREYKKLNLRIDELTKLIPDAQEYKKQKDDVKTLFQNQQMLLSLINAVRVRINNFYAKKLREPRLKSTGFESTKEFGEI